MITCQRCKEVNSSNRTTCWSCNTNLGVGDRNRKMCRVCGSIYTSRIEHCPDCLERLTPYQEQEVHIESSSDDAGCSMYVLAVLIPLLGIILGLIYIDRKEDEVGKALILTGVISNIVFAILFALFVY